MANSVDSDQTAPIGAVCSESTLFASMLNSSVMIGNYLQQTTSADNIFRCIFFLGTIRVNCIANEHVGRTSAIYIKYKVPIDCIFTFIMCSFEHV